MKFFAIFLLFSVVFAACTPPEQPKEPTYGVYIGQVTEMVTMDSMGNVLSSLETIIPGQIFKDLETTQENNQRQLLAKVATESGVEGWIPKSQFIPNSTPAVVVFNSAVFNDPEQMGSSNPNYLGSLKEMEIVAIDSSSEGWHRIVSNEYKGYVFINDVSTRPVDLNVARNMEGFNQLNLASRASRMETISGLPDINNSHFYSFVSSKQYEYSNLHRQYWQEGLYYPERIEYYEETWETVEYPEEYDGYTEEGEYIPEEEYDESDLADLESGQASDEEVVETEFSDDYVDEYELMAGSIVGEGFTQGLNTLAGLFYDMNSDMPEMEDAELSEFEADEEYVYSWGLKAYQIRIMMMALGAPDPYTGYDNQMFYLNDEFVNWCVDNMVPAASSQTQAIYENQFRKFFRIMALGLFHVSDESGDELSTATANYMAIFDGNEMANEEYYGGVGYLYETYKGVQLTDNSGKVFNSGQYYDVMEAWHAIGFWLRRKQDGTWNLCWNGLKKVLLTYDVEWFEKNTPSYLK